MSFERAHNQAVVSKWLVVSVGAYALLGSIITLVGWFAGLRPLTDWLDTGISMFPNTALAAACASAAFLLRACGREQCSLARRLLGAAVALIGGATLFEHVSGMDLGIDTLLASDPWGTRGATAAGRMGPPASLSFTLIGTGLVLLDSNSRARRAVPVFGLLTVMIATLALVGYAFGADPLFSVARVSGIALQTATFLFALGIALLASVPDLEPVSRLCEHSAAGLLARRALPFTLVVPILSGWVFVHGRRAGWFDRGMGTAVLVLFLLTFFSVLLWWCASALAAHEKISRENAARFRSYFELGLVGMAITSPSKGIVEVNDEVCKILGYDRSQLLRMTWADLTHPEDLTVDLAQFNRIVSGEIDGYSIDKRFLHRGGRVIHATISVKAVRQPDGSIVNFVALLQDITERKLAENALRKAQDELVQVNKDLETRVEERTALLRDAMGQLESFSFTVSHDLRAPLRGVRAYTQMLTEDFSAELPPQAKEYLNRIVSSVTRLENMISDVLTLSRVARSEIQLQPVNTDALVRQIVETYPGLQPPQARVHIDPLPEVLGHEPYLVQAFSNLLNNAVKFVAPGVTPQVRVWSLVHDGKVRLSIADNGIGIEPEYQGRLFGMFERLHSHLKYEGTGVGLAIVRKAVERMGGKVGLESDGVNGSCFWIELPSAHPPVPRISYHETPAAPGSPGVPINAAL